METYQYAAFISYRHRMPDEAIAKKLHTLIETYHIPADIQKSTGRKKMGRVFRDQEELPLSTDLGNDIKTALEHSDWLIALCSPSYLESKWCMTEIEYFISLGKRDHVLAILVDGEPDNAFPEPLRYIDTPEGRVEVEPLAGDVRAGSVSESIKKLKREKLRMLAPMLNVTFDALRQRERRRKTRLAILSSSAVILALSGFLTYALVKNSQITSQNKMIIEQNEQISEQNAQILAQNEEISKQRDKVLEQNMQTLIEQARISVNGNNKYPAQKQLSEAASFRNTVGSVNDEALYSALEAALYTASFEVVQTIDNDNRKFSSIVFSHDDRYLLGITNQNSAALIDAENGKLLYTVSRSDVGKIDSVGFTPDDRYFFTVDSWYGYVSLYETATGQFYREFNASDGTAGNIGEKVFTLSDHQILVPLHHTLCVWDFEADTGEDILPFGEGAFASYIQPFLLDLSPDGSRVAIGSSGFGVGLVIQSLDGKNEIPLECDDERGYYSVRFSGDGKRVSASSGAIFVVWDADTGKQLLRGISNASTISMGNVCLNYDGSVLVIMESEYLGAFAVPSGELLWEKTTTSNIVTEACISPNGKYIAASGGIRGVFDIRTGETLSELPCTAFANDGAMVLCDTYSTSPAILTTPEGATAKFVDTYDGTLFTTPRYTNPSTFVMLSVRHSAGDYYSTFPGNVNRKSNIYIDPSTKYAACTHFDGFIEVFDITDPEQPKDAYCIAEHCYNSVEDLVFNGDLMASAGGYDPRVAVFDLKKGTMLHVLRGESYAHTLEFSKDGSKIILLSGYSKNIVFVYSVQTGNLLYRIEAPENTTFTEIGFSEDGRYAIAKLSDGRACLGELYGSLEEMIEKTER
ncbi:MAG: TIR domain-containing protein [Lachnospiraceae bacterium]|nr:TIR domain-containing protein [Lachnospiraceae bacterium]